MKKNFHPIKNRRSKKLNLFNFKEIGSKTILSSLLGTGLSFLHTDQIEAFPSYLDVNTLNGANGFSINGKVDGHRLGRSVSKAGDINADGFDDVIVATKFADEVYIAYGKSSGFPKEFEVANLNGTNGIVIKVPGEQYLTVGGGGDVNGDGIDDVIIGSPVLSNIGAGRAYVIFGRKNPPLPASLDVNLLNGVNGFVLTGITPGSWFGYSVAIAKDINGDGLDDMVVGAPYEFGPYGSDPGDLDGRAYIVLGKNNFPATLSAGNLSGYGFDFVVAENPNSQQNIFGTRVGWSVSGAGDVNGDGYHDVLVGAPRQHGLTDASGYGTDFAGVTYVLFGNSKLPDVPVETVFIEGRGEQDEMGRCVSEAGDVNGDGIDDLAISSPLATPDNAFVDGESYILHGHTNFVDIKLAMDVAGLPNIPDLTNGVMTIPDVYSSRSISGAGDMDGDGFSEVIIGNSDNGTPGCGVILGSSKTYPDPPGFILGYSPWNTLKNADRAFDIGSNALMGWSVSDAGDVNGDGLGDVIIGSPDANTPIKSKGGRAYVIFGRVDEVGDVDDDGSVDLILQKPYNPDYPKGLSLVYAALMTNGYYTGIKKNLALLPTADEKVVAVNDFDLDGVTDLATQNGTLVQLRKGPGYGVVASFSLPASLNTNFNYHVIGSGNIRGKEINGKKGYPELIIVRSAMPPTGTNYYYKVNQGSWSFGAIQALYTNSNGLYPVVGAGRFIANNIQTNRYSEVMMYSYFANGVNKDLYARQSSFTSQDQTKFLMTMYQDEVLGAGNFKVGNIYDEFIWSNSNNVYFSKWFSGYKLKSGEKVVGPK